MPKVYQATHVGKVRKNNEDSLIVIDKDTYVVADGMGGPAAGEVASKMLVDIVNDFLSAVPKPFNEDILKKAIMKSNAAIIRTAQNNPDYKGMGTTGTIMHIYDGRAYYAHVGDSRIYRFRNNQLEQVTEDHSYVESLVKRGKITAADAKVHPLKNLLTQAVGATEDISVDTASFSVGSGDIFLLCTDGLTNMVDDNDIAEILKSSDNPAEKLIQAALNNGGIDNISAIVVKM